MATRLYGISPGETSAGGVTEGVGSATAADVVELTIDLAALLDGSARTISRQEVINAVEEILDHIREDIWPPA